MNVKSMLVGLLIAVVASTGTYFIRLLLAVTLSLSFVKVAASGAGNRIDIVYPKGAPYIASGFHSMSGINGFWRTNKHQGIDITGDNGQPIIAAADGKVLDAEVENCWGPTVSIDHGEGLDGRNIIALYGHVGEILVNEGEEIKRGQIIARLGDNHYDYKCIYRVRHLHFQIGRIWNVMKNFGRGHKYFLEDGDDGVNPHIYWADGPGMITCFDPKRTYKPGTLTYPVPCQ